jgi:HTH-type transcriptional regulator/antitoxin HigA
MNAAFKTAVTYWPRVAPVLKPARSRADYERLVLALEYVLDAGGADEKHPLSLLGASAESTKTITLNYD